MNGSLVYFGLSVRFHVTYLQPKCNDCWPLVYEAPAAAVLWLTHDNVKNAHQVSLGSVLSLQEGRQQSEHKESMETDQPA